MNLITNKNNNSNEDNPIRKKELYSFQQMRYRNSEGDCLGRTPNYSNVGVVAYCCLCFSSSALFHSIHLRSRVLVQIYTRHNMHTPTWRVYSERELSPFQQVYFLISLFCLLFVYYLFFYLLLLQSTYCVHSFVHTSELRNALFQFGDEKEGKIKRSWTLQGSSIAQTSAKERWMRYCHPIRQ